MFILANLFSVQCRQEYDGTLDNRQHWQDLAEKVEMGLTWIDHDTIDKPVEEFSACSNEIKDIEFTVTTFHNPNAEQSPKRRQRFSSLRKTGALSRTVRLRLSKSFYNNNYDNKVKESTAGNIVIPSISINNDLVVDKDDTARSVAEVKKRKKRL